MENRRLDLVGRLGDEDPDHILNCGNSDVYSGREIVHVVPTSAEASENTKEKSFDFFMGKMGIEIQS